MSINHSNNRFIIGGTLSRCPKCGGRYNARPAISRVDNKTKICPMCGVKEAMEDFRNYMKDKENGGDSDSKKIVKNEGAL